MGMKYPRWRSAKHVLLETLRWQKGLGQSAVAGAAPRQLLTLARWRKHQHLFT
jgi:hypothetical protein